MLNDSNIYVEAAEAGIGIHEMEPNDSVREELKRWVPLMKWLDDPTKFLAKSQKPAPQPPHLNIVNK